MSCLSVLFILVHQSIFPFRLSLTPAILNVTIVVSMLVEISSFYDNSKGIGSSFCFFMLLNYFHASNFSRVSAIGRGKIFEKNIDRAYVYNGEIREKFFIRIITSTRRGDDRSILVYLYVLQLNQFFFFFYSNNSLFHIFEMQFYFTLTILQVNRNLLAFDAKWLSHK